MTISVAGDIIAPVAHSTSEKLLGIICDTSGSMQDRKIQAAKTAMIKLVNLLPEDTHFFIVTGSYEARLIVPLMRASQSNKANAINLIRSIHAQGGTVMSSWLAEARRQFQRMPEAIRQAILLTDGQNDREVRRAPQELL
jgi:Mg-chelatase subunit ChlD